MTWKTLACAVVLACGVLALAGPPASADDQKQPALSGVWQQTGGELRLESSGQDVLKIFPHGDQVAITILCQAAPGKDGRVRAKVTGFEGKEDLKEKIKAAVPVGTEFTFRWQAKDDRATLEDVKGEKVEHLKAHLEGKYDRK